MKKAGLFVLALMVVFTGCEISDDSLDQERLIRPDDIQNSILIGGDSIQEILSVENDGSLPPESPIQQYEVLYATKEGLKAVFWLQIETNKAGEMVDAWIVSAEKGFSVPVISTRCPEGCQFRCVVVVDLVRQTKYYICVCIGGAHC